MVAIATSGVDDGSNGRRITRSSIRLENQKQKSSPLKPKSAEAVPTPSPKSVKRVIKGCRGGPSSPNSKKRKLDEDTPAPAPAVVPPAEAEIENEDVKGGSSSASAMVTDTLRKFNKCYLHFVQEEEKRVGKPKSSGKGSPKRSGKASPKSKKVKEDDIRRGSQRPDLKALTKMREMKYILNPEKKIGSIPGIEVGHQFFSRVEMCVLGFHSHWLNGIDFIGMGKRSKLGNYELPIATCIVVSGQYEDDLDNHNVIVYTGQGGNNLLGDKRQMKDQELKRGNLALKNSKDQEVPVRVVRGHKCSNSYVGKVYTYDGLYKICS